MFQPAKSLDEALSCITDGSMLVVPREVTGAPMAATRALIRRGVKHLHLITLPTSTLQTDLLVGAGCVETLETSAVSLGEFGPAPRFCAAVTQGAIVMKDATCPALLSQLQAAEKGVPFMPLRGLIGSDVLKYRDDWKVIDSPFGNSDPVVLLPALKPDVALLHASMADRFGNVWIGRHRELATMAHAAAKTVVTVEKIHDGNLLDDPAAGGRHAAGILHRGDRAGRARRLAAAAAGLSTAPTTRISRCTRRWRRRRKASRNISTGSCMRSRRRDSSSPPPLAGEACPRA